MFWVECEPRRLVFVGVWTSSWTMVSVVSSFQDAANFSVFPDGYFLECLRVRSLSRLAADVPELRLRLTSASGTAVLARTPPPARSGRLVGTTAPPSPAAVATHNPDSYGAAPRIPQLSRGWQSVYERLLSRNHVIAHLVILPRPACRPKRRDPVHVGLRGYLHATLGPPFVLVLPCMCCGPSPRASVCVELPPLRLQTPTTAVVEKTNIWQFSYVVCPTVSGGSCPWQSGVTIGHHVVRVRGKGRSARRSFM